MWNVCCFVAVRYKTYPPTFTGCECHFLNLQMSLGLEISRCQERGLSFAVELALVHKPCSAILFKGHPGMHVQGPTEPRLHANQCSVYLGDVQAKRQTRHGWRRSLIRLLRELYPTQNRLCTRLIKHVPPGGDHSKHRFSRPSQVSRASPIAS